jgi:nanoRNase/pAp phosphatase (c-di-AMP/oligoRNAs hydrolase)
VRISVAIKEQERIFRISLRAKDKELDVSKVATFFGGGGHRAAAAFRYRQDLASLKPALLNELEKLL